MLILDLFDGLAVCGAGAIALVGAAIIMWLIANFRIERRGDNDWISEKQPDDL